MGVGNGVHGVCRRGVVSGALASAAGRTAARARLRPAAVAAVEKVIMSQAHSQLEKVKLRLEIFALGVGILVGIGGSVVGLIAWNESRNTNRLNVDTQQALGLLRIDGRRIGSTMNQPAHDTNIR